MLAPDFTPPAAWTLRTDRNPPPAGAHGTQVVRHETWTDALAFMTGPKDPRFPGSSSREFNGTIQWDLGAGWEGAVAMATSRGWPEGRDRMSEALEGAANLARFDPAPATERDVAGAYPIVPVAVAGDPCAMVLPADMDRARRPILRVVANVSRSAVVKADAIANLFGAVLSCIDAVEAAGTSVEIVAVDSYSGEFLAGGPENRPAGAGALFHEVTIKQAGEPLELDRIAFALAHPAYLRRLGFRFLERFPHAAPIAGSYGRPADVPADQMEPGTVYIPAGYGEWMNACANRAHALAHALHFFNNPIGAGA
ncbi:MAG: hypothetical protein AB7P02_12690 [Alphaproteobacteria bacterium]